MVIDLTRYGVAATLISIITILIVGCVKSFSAIKAIPSKQQKKAAYQSLSLAISVVLSTVCYFIFFSAEAGKEFLAFVLTSAVETNALYPIYENYGLRGLLLKLYTVIFPKKKEVEETTTPDNGDT